MPQRVTLRDIARKAKLHASTVSRALRNHPNVPPSTRLRVQKISKKLGYIPDPKLASLAIHLRNLHGVSYQATLAWVFNGSNPNWWRGGSIYNDFYDGARMRAEELGYKLEIFWLNEAGMSMKRASSVLRARNISGLVIAPLSRTFARLNLDWSFFSTVAIGYSLISPQLHRVAPNHFSAAKTLVHQLWSYGYRRIGFASKASLDQRMQHGWSGGYMTYLAEKLRRYPDAPIVPFFTRDLSPQRIEPSFWKWYEKYRPEVIITPSATFVPELLKKRGLQVPRDVGLAYLNLQAETGPQAGIYEKPVKVGAAAIELLTGMLQHHEKGIPESPKKVLIEGAWKDGNTLRKMVAPKIGGVASKEPQSKQRGINGSRRTSVGSRRCP